MTKAIALFSGGLDSILACRVVARQGIEVVAVRFISPFFNYDLLLNPSYPSEIKAKYGIDVVLRDVSAEYIALLRAPAHGYGKNFNPCLDCKIFMMTKARELMQELGASFLISGEVLGQRPMSQRRDALRVVERDSGCDGLLLRPLCAKHLKPTRLELEGVVNREQLCDFSGRGRSQQIALAKEMGVVDYPTPSGGCVLTDVNVSGRIKRYYEEHEILLTADMRLLVLGRHYLLPGGAWLAMGRGEVENETILRLAGPDDRILKLVDRPGPTGLVRNLRTAHDLAFAAGLVARYGKKGDDGLPMPGEVECVAASNTMRLIGVPPEDSLSHGWIR